MTETPRAKEKPAVSKRRVGKAQPEAQLTPKQAAALQGVRLAQLDPAYEEALLVEAAAAGFRVTSSDELRDRNALAAKKEQEEATEIYHRIDRELAVEEARADRLLRLYNL